jgi:hypothetical protein
VGEADIVINEFVADPEEDRDEWIELYNNTSSTIDLIGWTIEDNTGPTYGESDKFYSLEGLIIEPGGFLVLEKGEDFKFTLNNSGDIIVLNYGSSTIDQVAYGNYDDGEAADNAPKASDPYSVARVYDGYDTNYDVGDFVVTTIPTKGEANEIAAPPTSDASFPASSGSSGGGGYYSPAPTPQKEVYSPDIIINEILPNPEGSDTKDEWVELKNKGDSLVDLEGWKVSDASSKIYPIESDDFSSTRIKPGEYF